MKDEAGIDMFPAMATDPRIILLLDILDRGFDKASWHGPNLLGTLRRIKPDLAVRRLPGRKTIWEQLLHAAYWKQRVLNKVAGTQRFARAGSNWPRQPQPPTAAAWAADIALLRDIHARLRLAVAELDPGRLADAKLMRMIHGAALHDIYHAGQIKLLRRLLEDTAA
jgi:hypothetical protein